VLRLAGLCLKLVTQKDRARSLGLEVAPFLILDVYYNGPNIKHRSEQGILQQVQ